MCCEKGNICTHTVQIQEFQYLNVNVLIIWEVLFSIVSLILMNRLLKKICKVKSVK